MSEIISPNKKERNSSVELFRILATFLVLFVHLNGWLVGGLPSPFSFDNVCSQTVGQIIIQSLCVVCVNCFLIISGFYGIKLKFKTIWNLFVLLFVIYSFCFVVGLLLGDEFHFSSLGFLLPFSRESYFVQCYLMLCFLSPVLNAFVDSVSRRTLLLYVLVFFFIEFYFGCLRHNVSLGFNRGYSVIHFVLMYLLACCLSKYKNEVMTLNRSWYVSFYFVASAIVAIMYFLGGVKWTWNYSNPVVIVSAFCLFIPFLYSNYYIKWINWVASSTFAVYILHTCSPFIDVLRQLDVYALSHYSYSVYLLCFVGLALAAFVCSILFDKVRLFLFGRMSDRLGNYINDKIVQVVNGR